MNPTPFITPAFSRFLGMSIRHIKYVVSTSRYVRKLQTRREALEARKNDINDRIDGAERRSQRPNDEVLVWRNQVVGMLDRIDTALNIAPVSCVCLIFSKHKIGRSCADMIKEVDELLGRAPFSHNAEMVDFDPNNTAIPMPYVVQESLEPYFAESCRCIEDDKSNANIVGIWGLGGVGKTTLLNKIHNYFVQPSSMFETVISIVASSEQSNVYRVQSEIIKKLRLNESGDVQSQARLINSFLENKNFLLFIDDLWEDVELHKVGVPNPNEGNQIGKKRKVIFTTRSKEVCGKMEARKIIEVKCLDPTQSLILFTEKVGQEVIRSHPGIPILIEDIAKECEGLPLALITIGRAMSTKSDIEDWKNTLNQLKNSQDLLDLGVEEQLLHVLKISYDYLATDQLRKCFLAISMWPEDYVFDANELIKFWMSMGLIDNFENKREVYQIGHSLIRSLQNRCLLEDYKCYGYQHARKMLKMHDVLRDLALWIASDCGKNKNKWCVKAGIQLQKSTNMNAKWRVAECISLMYNDIENLPSDIPSCPSILTLVLRYNRLGTSELNCFGKFHSLTHLDLSKNYFKSFPESICDLTELRYLNLSCNEITNLPMRLRNLKVLRYLMLRWNLITNIPRGVFAELAELVVLDMFEAIDTSVYPSVDVEELKSIENKLLCFGTTVGTEKELSKLMLLSELPLDDLCISSLRSTTFHFMSMIRNAHRLKKLYISSSNRGLSEIVFDKNETDQDIASLNLETLELCHLYKLKRIIWKDIAPEILFVELRKVTICYCRLIEDITWVINLPSLKYLLIHNCYSMRIAINNDMDPQVINFPSLERFFIAHCEQLEKISTHSLSFPQLKKMYICGCPLVKALPFEVNTSPKLRKIMGDKEWWEKVEWEDDNTSSHFNQFFKDHYKYTLCEKWEDDNTRSHFNQFFKDNISKDWIARIIVSFCLLLLLLTMIMKLI